MDAVPHGNELDVFDLVTHVAFGAKPLTRRERAQNVKKRDVFGKYGEQARVVLEALLEKYQDHGILDLEDPRILEMPPFDQIGSKHHIRRTVFGGAENFSTAIAELERELYSGAA